MTSNALPLAEQLILAKGWDNMLRQLMLAGKHLRVLPDVTRTDSTEVKGCQSRVWLTLEKSPVDGCVMLAWSDSKIIRGVLAIIQEKVNSLDAEALAKFDFPAYFSAIGLDRYLSQSRANGIKDVVARIQG
ncbi:SufE family protein [Aestuariibacter sp. GS-14]|uniref:SufE family protein n=1 Tax=Aestuariibacter sp. GS-14 TaxID=2590670 RepID=UPI00112ED7D3|nr:SufE family protein [Aestuariibacter sp. GS-14]TPV59719.1 SufE family protein [Aestuariibacter sp. GS-14]